MSTLISKLRMGGIMIGDRQSTLRFAEPVNQQIKGVLVPKNNGT